MHFVGEIHGRHLARAFASGFGILANAADNHATEIKLRAVAPSLLRALFHDVARVPGKFRRGNAGGEQPLSHGARKPLQHRPRCTDVERGLPARRVCIRLECRSESLESFAFVFHFLAGKHGFDDFDALAHHGGGADFPALFAFADFFHENLRRAETKEEPAFSGGLLENAGFHGNLHGMTCVGRNDAPADGDSFCFPRDDGGGSGTGARFHGVLAPPGIRFGQPEDLEAGGVASLRHVHCLVERLHAQLQNTYFEGQGH